MLVQTCGLERRSRKGQFILPTKNIKFLVGLTNPPTHPLLLP